VHEGQRRALGGQVAGGFFCNPLAIVTGSLVDADGARRHDVAQLGLAGEEGRRQPGLLRVREDGRRLDVALARAPGVPGQAVLLGLDAREHRGVRRQRRSVADGERVIAVAAALAQEVVPLQVQRGDGVGAQPVLGDDEDVVDARTLPLDERGRQHRGDARGRRRRQLLHGERDVVLVERLGADARLVGQAGRDQNA
jgi:hypothetical protein